MQVFQSASQIPFLGEEPTATASNGPPPTTGGAAEARAELSEALAAACARGEEGLVAELSVGLVGLEFSRLPPGALCAAASSGNSAKWGIFFLFLGGGHAANAQV